jgi:hypothetical protein
MLPLDTPDQLPMRLASRRQAVGKWPGIVDCPRRALRGRLDHVSVRVYGLLHIEGGQHLCERQEDAGVGKESARADPSPEAKGNGARVRLIAW